MIDKLGILVLLLIFVSPSQAQSNLTLEEAVLGQWGRYRPVTLTGLQWIGDTDELVYFSNRGAAIHKMSMNEKSGKPWVTLEDVSKAIKGKLGTLYGTQILSTTKLIVDNGSSLFSYNPTDKTAKQLVSYAQNAENVHRYKGRVAFTSKNNLYLAKDDQTKIPITKFIDKNIVSGQAIARSEFGISGGIFWSPSGQKIGFYQKDESQVSDYPLLDVTTTPGQLINIKYPMAGQASEKAKIGIYDIESGKTTYLKIPGDPEQYLTNFSWGPAEKHVYVAVVNRDQNAMSLLQIDPIKGNVIKTLLEEKHDKYVEPENPAWFIPGSTTQFAWLSEKDGFMHLYLHNTDDSKSRQLTKGNFVVQSILGLDYKKKNIIITTTDESGLNTAVRSVNLKTGTTITLTKEAGQHSAQLSPNGRYIIDAYSTLDTPGIQRIIDVKGKLINVIHVSENPYAKGQLGTTEFIDLKANDGTILHGRMIKPSNFDPSKKYPVLVYVYGGPHAQMITNSWLGGASLWMHYMAQKDYIIWTLDNRGSANRGRDFENVIHRRLGDIEMEDQLAGVDYLKGLDFVDSEKMAVHGWSFGGFMTTSLMLRHPNVFKVGVAGGPVTDWKYYEIMYGERYMDRPEQNKEGYANARLHNHVKNLKGDLLLIHGTIDDVVVMQHNLSLVKAFVDEGILMDFFPYPNHPHNVRGKDRVHLMNKVLTYIEDKLED